MKYRFKVISRSCTGVACLACERADLMPGLVTKYNGNGLISERHMEDLEILQRLHGAQKACPCQAIVLDVV